MTKLSGPKLSEDSDAYPLHHMKLHKRNGVQVSSYCEAACYETETRMEGNGLVSTDGPFLLASVLCSLIPILDWSLIVPAAKFESF